MANPRHEDQTRSYKSFVAARTQRNPGLQNLNELLQIDSEGQHSCQIVCLEFFSASGPPSRQSLDLCGLASILSNEAQGRQDLCGRLLIIEDICKNTVETLGSLLNVDPFFFASHIDTFPIDIARTRPSMSTLPSITRTHNFLNLHYHRVIELDKPESIQALLRDMNVPRKVRILPKFKGTNIGLVRHCCSILKTKGQDGLWLGLILVDAPISNSYVMNLRDHEPQNNENTNSVTLQTRLFQGGYQDFLSKTTFLDNIDHESGPIRSSPLESFIFYWCLQRPPGFNVNCPTLFTLSYYALRTDVAEWMTYLELMYHCIKQYEYSPDAILASIGHIKALTADIHNVQRWARRIIATGRKIRYVIDFLKHRVTEDEDMDCSALIIRDYEQITLSLDSYSHRLEAMVSVATSLIQAIDCRRSLTETMNISRLTYLALSFIPLTFVSGVFSMNDNIAQGGRLFGLYFAISIPLCILVFLIAHPPTGTAGTFAAWIRRSRVIQSSKV